MTEKTGKPRFYFVTTERGTLQQNHSVLVDAAKPAETEQHSAMPTGDVYPASPVHVTHVLPVPSTLLRPHTPQVPPSPQTAVPVATLGTTLEECVPLKSPSPTVLKTWSGKLAGLESVESDLYFSEESEQDLDDGFLRRKEACSVYLVMYSEANMEMYPVTWKLLLRS